MIENFVIDTIKEVIPVVVFLDRGYPCFRSFNSTIPVDVVKVKSYVNSFLDPTCVPVRISINRLDPGAIIGDGDRKRAPFLVLGLSP